ncbi:hypothetical protein PMI06_009181 [Burkholderia sp. BT03]|nr:hypothetical protein PMI06_009181 [Burkholderia sp. BT03]SKC95333.1 hypothetical protein SAMN06266956_6904 [Paraburkholderia hospita]
MSRHHLKPSGDPWQRPRRLARQIGRTADPARKGEIAHQICNALKFALMESCTSRHGQAMPDDLAHRRGA